MNVTAKKLLKIPFIKNLRRKLAKLALIMQKKYKKEEIFWQKIVKLFVLALGEGKRISTKPNDVQNESKRRQLTSVISKKAIS